MEYVCSVVVFSIMIWLLMFLLKILIWPANISHRCVLLCTIILLLLQICWQNVF